MVDEAMVTGSVRGTLARRFTAVGMGVALALCVIAYAVTWQWSGSVRHDLAKLLAGFEGETAEVKVSQLLSRRLDEFMRERIADVQGWASGPAVVSAARQAHSVHEQSGLLSLTVEQIEEKFQIRKSLGRFPIADSYMRSEIARSKHFDRITLTDRNGYNVVVTNVSSDFVQSDEDWWQRAWSDGFAISRVKYDENIGAWEIDISVRIDDPATENPVGVIQAAMTISLLQDIADQYLGRDQRITIVNSEGLLLAETSSEHSSARIMNEKVNVRDRESDARSAVFGVEHSGQVIDDDWVTGFSRTAGGEFYADLTRDFRFPGFHWGVIVQSGGGGALAGAGIESAAREVGTWHRTYAGILAVSFVILALLATWIAWWMAGRIAQPIRYLRTVALQMSQGRATGTVRLETNDELSEIARALERMRRTVQMAVRIMRERRRSQSS